MNFLRNDGNKCRAQEIYLRSILADERLYSSIIKIFSPIVEDETQVIGRIKKNIAKLKFKPEDVGLCNNLIIIAIKNVSQNVYEPSNN